MELVGPEQVGPDGPDGPDTHVNCPSQQSISANLNIRHQDRPTDRHGRLSIAQPKAPLPRYSQGHLNGQPNR
jgi:hypothetical protein